MIRYLSHSQIDKNRWDQCIDNACNSYVYAKSWYLDIVSPKWDALVNDDYSKVMPLTRKSRYGLLYLIQPKFTQQLGIFSTLPLTKEDVQEFLDKIPLKFIWCDINLNFQNPVDRSNNISFLDNYELELGIPYDEIYKNYNRSTRYNISYTKRHELVLEFNPGIDLFFDNLVTNSKMEMPPIAVKQLRRIIETAVQKGTGEAIVCRSKQGNILGGAFFLYSSKRIIYLVSFSNAEGRDLSAMFMIIDHVIKTNAGKEMIFDFEGSMIPGIADFIKGFGATLINYPRFRKKLFL